MIDIGKFNRLPIVKIVDFGVYLDGDHLGNILLPKRYVPDGLELGDFVDAFIYFDSDDLIIATTEKPYVTVGQCAYLKVTDVNDIGAFLDWGLSKDLLVPYGEQHKPFELGKSYVVTVYIDEHTDRIVASSKLSYHLMEQSTYFKLKQEVELLICGKSELGYKAVINNTHIGLLFRDDAFKPLRYGKKLPGYIKEIRADRKIGVSMQLPSGMGKDDLTNKIIAHLKALGGSSPFTDKAAPDDIYNTFSVSKKNYKKALGALYKQKVINIEKDKISLI
jgi:predicted RNA-binding protein (virulence factor B family)